MPLALVVILKIVALILVSSVVYTLTITSLVLLNIIHTPLEHIKCEIPYN